jgi:CxxC motif-containing protein
MSKSITEKTEALAAVKNDGWALEDASDELKADKEVVMAAVQENGRALQFVSDELKADKEVVMAAVKNQVSALEFATDELKADKKWLIAAVKNDGGALGYASDELKADREMVMVAVKNSGDALYSASDELSADKEMVMVAVKNYGGALEYASDELKADKEVVMAAVQENGGALQFASDELKADKEVVMVAVKNDGYALKDASDELRADKEVVMVANPLWAALEYVSDELKADKEVVMAAVKIYGGALEYASDELKADKEVVTAGGEKALEYALNEQNNKLVIEVNGRGGDFSYHRLPIDEYKELKDTSFKWMTEKYGDEALLEDVEVMWDISMAEVTITLNGKTLISEQELSKLAKTKIENSQKFWRDFAGADLGEVGMVWFHDSMVTSRYEWLNVEEWDPSKLTIDAWESPLSDEKDGQCYGDFTVDYNGENPDESDFDSSPKTGYYGPFYFPPKKK